MMNKWEGSTLGKNEVLDIPKIILFAGTPSYIAEDHLPTLPSWMPYWINNPKPRFSPSPWRIAPRRLAHRLSE